MVSINTNLTDMIILDSLNDSTNGINKSIERLTTGYKINHAKDNAANLSIVTNLSTKISSLLRVRNNTEDGISLLSTAQGGLEEISNLLSRLRTLSVQAMNGTYGNQSLEAMQAEADEIIAQINYIRENTEFNGMKLFYTPANESITTTAVNNLNNATVQINGTTYEAKKDDLFICPPNNIVDSGLMSIDFQGHCICVSSSYIQQIVPLAENLWDIKMLFDANPICTLQPEEAKIFCQYYDFLCTKTQYSSVKQKRVIGTIMLALIYDMQIVLERVVQHNPRPFTSRETLFKRFIDLIESSYPRPRSVSYYAERLNVTPKYFSSVCRQVGGQKATDFIDQYVVKDIVYLMNHTQKSIKEIACELDFSNLSFFGK